MCLISRRAFLGTAAVPRGSGGAQRDEDHRREGHDRPRCGHDPESVDQLIMGQDPLDMDKVYTTMLLRSGGGYGAIAGVTVTAASGEEISL